MNEGNPLVEELKAQIRESLKQREQDAAISFSGSAVKMQAPTWRLIVGFALAFVFVTPFCIALLEHRMDERYEVRFVKKDTNEAQRLADSLLMAEINKNRDARLSSIERKLDDLTASFLQLRKDLKP